MKMRMRKTMKKTMESKDFNKKNTMMKIWMSITTKNMTMTMKVLAMVQIDQYIS